MAPAPPPPGRGPRTVRGSLGGGGLVNGHRNGSFPEQGPRSVRCLIVGAGQAGRTLARDLRRMPEFGLRPVGFLDDNPRKWRFIDFAGAKPLGTFRAHQDLFGDGSVLLIDAAGATAGGLAVLVRLPAAPVMLCGNLAWTVEQYRYARLPGLLADRDAWWEKVWRLKKFKELVPELAVLPDHDWAAIEAAKTKDMVLHPFSVQELTEDSVKKTSENKARKDGQSKRRQKQATQKKRTEQRGLGDRHRRQG